MDPSTATALNVGTYYTPQAIYSQSNGRPMCMVTQTGRIRFAILHLTNIKICEKDVGDILLKNLNQDILDRVLQIWVTIYLI